MQNTFADQRLGQAINKAKTYLNELYDTAREKLFLDFLLTRLIFPAAVGVCTWFVTVIVPGVFKPVTPLKGPWTNRHSSMSMQKAGEVSNMVISRDGKTAYLIINGVGFILEPNDSKWRDGRVRCITNHHEVGTFTLTPIITRGNPINVNGVRLESGAAGIDGLIIFHRPI